MIIYPGMPHGFLSFATLRGMRECHATVEDASNLLDNLLSQSHYKSQMTEFINNKVN